GEHILLAAGQDCRAARRAAAENVFEAAARQRDIAGGGAGQAQCAPARHGEVMSRAAGRYGRGAAGRVGRMIERAARQHVERAALTATSTTARRPPADTWRVPPESTVPELVAPLTKPPEVTFSMPPPNTVTLLSVVPATLSVPPLDTLR